MYKKELALNDLQWLICHKSKTNQTKAEALYIKSETNNNKNVNYLQNTLLGVQTASFLLELWNSSFDRI